MTILPHLEFTLRRFPGYGLIRPLIEAAALRRWQRLRQPPAPRPVKAAIIRQFADHRARRTFVETGTFFGDMLAEVRPDFDHLFSIELHPMLGIRAQRRFAADANVTVIIGDSATELGPLLRTIHAPAVLWLDGHYSGFQTARGAVDTPILIELEAVFREGTIDDVVLIDDARLFGVDPAYPALADLEERMKRTRPDWNIRIVDDIIQMCGRRARPSEAIGTEPVTGA